MAEVRWDKVIIYKNYEVQPDGSYALGEEKKLSIKAFQPLSQQAVVGEDGTISREYQCIAQPTSDIRQGSICEIDNKRYLVSGILPYDFVGNVANNTQLTLREKDAVESS